VPARVRDTLPGKLLLIPLPSRPFFPAQTMPIVLPEDPRRETVERVGNTPQRLVGLVHATGNMHELPSPENFRRIGTVVRMHQPMRGDGHIQFVAEGLQRFRILDWASDKAPFLAQVDYPEPPPENTQELRAYGLAVIAKIKELLPLNPFYRENVKAYLERFSPDDASPLADFAAALTSASRYQPIFEYTTLESSFESGAPRSADCAFTSQNAMHR
jgi:ATP-dependent Lon protease